MTDKSKRILAAWRVLLEAEAFAGRMNPPGPTMTADDSRRKRAAHTVLRDAWADLDAAMAWSEPGEAEAPRVLAVALQGEGSARLLDTGHVSVDFTPALHAPAAGDR